MDTTTWTDTVTETYEQRVERLLPIALRQVAPGDEVGHRRALKTVHRQAALLVKLLPPRRQPQQP